MKKHKHKNDEQPTGAAAETVPSGTAVTPPESAGPAPAATTAGEGGAWQVKYEELFAQLQRLAADYQNYQKRSMRQSEQAVQHAREEFARMLLPVLDNFEHALAKGCELPEAVALLEGIRIVYDHLMASLSSVGMKRIEVQPGCPFDPTRHEAMLQEENGQWAPNCVVRELACGYTMNERTLRPAKVSVARRPAVDPAVGDGAPASPDNEPSAS